MAKNLVFVGDARDNYPVVAEALAAQADIKAGLLLTKDSAGKFIKHNVAGESGMAYIANLDAVGQANMTDTYASGDVVFAFEPKAGQLFNVVVAAGNNITAKDTPLTSNGDGTLKIAATNGTEEVIAYADEVADFTAAAGLCRVKIGNAGFTTATA